MRPQNAEWQVWLQAGLVAGRSGCIGISRRDLLLSAVTAARLDAVRNGGAVEITSNILTIKEVANILRCSNARAERT